MPAIKPELIIVALLYAPEPLPSLIPCRKFVIVPVFVIVAFDPCEI